MLVVSQMLDRRSEHLQGRLRQRERESALPTQVSRVAAGWALFSAAYRGYYALGGTLGMFGTPAVSESQ